MNGYGLFVWLSFGIVLISCSIVYYKTKKEMDKYSTKEQLTHGGYVAEIEHLEEPDLKMFIKDKCFS